MGRQSANYKKRALFQLHEVISEIKKSGDNPKLVKKLNKIKSTLEKIKHPQNKQEEKRLEKIAESEKSKQNKNGKDI